MGNGTPFQHLLKTSGHSLGIPEDATSKCRNNRHLPTKKLSKVNFKRNAKRNHSLDQIIMKQNDSDDLSDRIFNFSPILSQSALVSVANMLDDDPFDYDIVNIDQKWLQDVPSNEVRKLRVREAEIIDIPNIAHLLYPLDAKDTMHAIETMILSNKENHAYVFTSGMSIVGIAILEFSEEIDFIRGRFNLDAFQLHKYRYECHGIDAGHMNIKTIIAYPVFEPHFRFFTRELMRLSGSNTLMYVTGYRNKWAVHKVNVAVSSMIPLMPREMEIDSETVPELKRIGTMLNEMRRPVAEYCPLDVPRYSDTELQITCDDTPRNVFIINHVIEAQKALDYVKQLSWTSDAKVIVYGATVKSYLCINALLTINVPPEDIIFIEPFPSENPEKIRVPEFCNENLGTRIREQLDPMFKEATADAKNSPRKSSKKSSYVSFYDHQEIEFEKPNLMELNKPKVKYCVLPGGLKYLEVRSPGLKLPHYYLQSLKYNGYVMETFKRGYFKLHLSKDLYVDGITCLSPGTFSLEKFKYLYGQSAIVLKNVHIRFSTNKLDDFYEFFEAPWAYFLYHDQIEDLFAMSKELFPKNQSSRRTIKEALQEDSKSLRHNLKKSPYVEVITDYVIDWLSNHEILLPMYLQPSNCIQFTHDLGTRLLFKAKKSKDGEVKS
ncbi:unnamed protein product [Arctia plantaginis]|uniref:CFAP61 dimerisation domain-containing protein n=1 Tax=Arctia plantaginis TaxID=874455 RepID=A0A8S1BDD1_ARCPL|nr:unnamed protein product [Arctia plantaginis]